MLNKNNKISMNMPTLTLKDIRYHVCSELLVEARYLRKYKQWEPKEVTIFYADKDIESKILDTLKEGISDYKNKKAKNEAVCPLVELNFSKLEDVKNYCSKIPQDGDLELCGLTIKEYYDDSRLETKIDSQEVRNKIFKIRHDSKNKFYEYFNVGVLYIHGSLEPAIEEYIKSIKKINGWSLVPTTWVVYMNISDMDKKQSDTIANFIGKGSTHCRIEREEL